MRFLLLCAFFNSKKRLIVENYKKENNAKKQPCMNNEWRTRDDNQWQLCSQLPAYSFEIVDFSSFTYDIWNEQSVSALNIRLIRNHKAIKVSI